MFAVYKHEPRDFLFKGRGRGMGVVLCSQPVVRSFRVSTESLSRVAVRSWWGQGLASRNGLWLELRKAPGYSSPSTSLIELKPSGAHNPRMIRGPVADPVIASILVALILVSAMMAILYRY